MLVNAANALRDELDRLLREPPSAALERERSTFDRAISPFKDRLILAGAGNLGRKALRALRADGVEPLAFTDNNEALWGSTRDGLTVLSPVEAARQYGQTATFCITIWRGEGTDTMRQRRQPLLDAGCVNVVDFGALFWKYGKTLLPHYSLDLPHKVLASAAAARAAFEVWNDAASQAEYVAQVRWRLWLDFDNLPAPVKEPIYFPRDLFSIRDDEVFVDCGAYDGDTVRDFVGHSGGRFKSIHAYEADTQNYLKLRRYIEALPLELQKRIQAHDAAVSDSKGFVHFIETGTAGSSVGGSGIPVRSVTLDDSLSESPTWIKMDIEGSEPAALRGAQRAIAAAAPVLSICVYHSQHHLWSIPLQIAATQPKYRCYLRPFVPESWDLVCYAVPMDRLLT